MLQRSLEGAVVLATRSFSLLPVRRIGWAMGKLAGLFGLERLVRTTQTSYTPRAKQEIGTVGAYIIRMISKTKSMGAGSRCFGIQSASALRETPENRSMGTEKAKS